MVEKYTSRGFGYEQAERRSSFEDAAQDESPRHLLRALRHASEIKLAVRMREFIFSWCAREMIRLVVLSMKMVETRSCVFYSATKWGKLFPEE